MKTVPVLVAILLLVGCSHKQWSGPAEISLKNGNVIQCPDGLYMEDGGINCYGSGELNGTGMNTFVRWKHVAGYRAIGETVPPTAQKK